MEKPILTFHRLFLKAIRLLKLFFGAEFMASFTILKRSLRTNMFTRSIGENVIREVGN